jgi:hypothetical protein
MRGARRTRAESMPLEGGKTERWCNVLTFDVTKGIILEKGQGADLVLRTRSEHR